MRRRIPKTGNPCKKAEIDEQVTELTATRDEVKISLESLQNRIQELNDSIEAGKNTIIDELNQRATIKSKIGRFDTMLEQVAIRKAELNSRILKAKSDEEDREENIKKLKEQFTAVSDALKEMKEKAEKDEADIQKIRGELTGKDVKLRETQEQYHQEKSRLEALSNLTERYEGYGGSVKKVMEQKNDNKGIIGVVADIIKVDKKYETAIETALGGNIQNIVTDDEETAKR